MDNLTGRTIHAIWKIEAARIIGSLARIVRNVGLAEDLAQDALLAALEQWPERGIPEKPAAWLMSTAHHKAIDLLRRDARLRRKLEEIGAVADAVTMPVEPDGPSIEDNRLRLIFAACHPALSPEAQIALTLRIVCGLTTEEIARACLTSETTMQQRILRAKKRLSGAGAVFDDLAPDQLPERLDAVLAVIYLIYNEGYAASSGADYLRLALCEEALRLGRMLAHMAPGESEVHALLALMELQSSRARARTDASGAPVALLEQNRVLWDHLQIKRGLDSLAKARSIPGPPGTYYIQAAIAACHARALTPGSTDWPQIFALYSLLATLSPSPVIRVNQAMAAGMARGPEVGLAMLEPLKDEPELKTYHLLWAALGDLMQRAGRPGDAACAFRRAASLTRNGPEAAALLAREAACSAEAKDGQRAQGPAA